MPAAWRTASKAGEVRSAVADQEPYILQPLAEGESEVAGLLHCPLAGGVRGDAAEVHSAGTVLDEHRHSVDASSSQSTESVLRGNPRR